MVVGMKNSAAADLRVGVQEEEVWASAGDGMSAMPQPAKRGLSAGVAMTTSPTQEGITTMR